MNPETAVEGQTTRVGHAQVPPSANRNTGVGGRGSPHAIARTKKAWGDVFGAMMMEAHIPRGLTRVRVTPWLTFRGPQRRDGDNFYFPIAKPLGDVLKAGGWIPDDTPDHFQVERVRITTGVRGLATPSYMELEVEWWR